MLVSVACKFPEPCWYSINIQSNPSYQQDAWLSSFTPPIPKKDISLVEVNKLFDIIYQGWNSMPADFDVLEVKEWAAKPLVKAGLLGIDLTLEALNHIRQGGAKDKNLYTPIERQDVQTIGFKPVWSPGGFQI
jgi:hypothetical protein|tara:strand:+ start:2083 stop:2481 length:399 start_codon:yes stop_codon:yes gene_type:complete